MEGGMVAILWVRSWALLSAEDACTSALCVVDPGRYLHLLLLTPVLIPQTIRKWLSNLLPQCSYGSKNVNQNLAGMNDVCKGEMQASYFPCPIKRTAFEPKNAFL